MSPTFYLLIQRFIVPCLETDGSGDGMRLKALHICVRQADAPGSARTPVFAPFLKLFVTVAKYPLHETCHLNSF